MPTTASEADIIFNKANIALARSQRLIASWLPPQTEEELRNAKSQEKSEEEEQEIFTPVPERLGLGAPLPKDIEDGSVKRQELSSNDKLRIQLLGKDHARLQRRSKDGRNLVIGITQLGSKPRPSPSTTVAQDDDGDDEEGRSSLGKPKRKKEGLDFREISSKDYLEKGMSISSSNVFERVGKSNRRQNYLDEVLAEKSRKRKKKRQKHRESAAAPKLANHIEVGEL